MQWTPHESPPDCAPAACARIERRSHHNGEFNSLYLRLSCALFAAISCPIWSFAQTVSLSLSTASGTPGGTVSLALSLNSGGGPQPAGVQWTMTYPALDLSVVQVTAGPSAIASGKSVFCASGASSYTCLVVGLNTSSIPDGVVVVLLLSISTATTSSSSYIQIENPVAASPSGGAIPVSASGAAVTILHTPLPLSISTTNLPTGVLGSAYAQMLAAAGGTPPYTWSLIGGAA